MMYDTEIMWRRFGRLPIDIAEDLKCQLDLGWTIRQGGGSSAAHALAQFSFAISNIQDSTGFLCAIDKMHNTRPLLRHEKK